MSDRIRHLLAALTILLVTAVASADTRLDFTRRAVQALPTFHEDRDYVDKAGQLEAISVAVAAASEKPPGGISPKQWAALMLTVAYSESGLSQRIVEHRCKRHECDSGRAKGLGQIHRNSLNASDWDNADGNLPLQIKMLDASLRRGFFTCSRSGVSFPASALSGYAGQRCGAQWRGLDKRVSTFSSLVTR